MLDLEELQTIAQLVNNIEAVSDRIENAYTKKDGEEFVKAKKVMLGFHDKIIEILQPNGNR